MSDSETAGEDLARLRAAAGDTELTQIRVQYCETVTCALESSSRSPSSLATPTHNQTVKSTPARPEPLSVPPPTPAPVRYSRKLV
jgi:hypothetical protein